MSGEGLVYQKSRLLQSTEDEEHTWWFSNAFPKASHEMLGFVQEILAVTDSIYQR